jgi:hypothetical protein
MSYKVIETITNKSSYPPYRFVSSKYCNDVRQIARCWVKLNTPFEVGIWEVEWVIQPDKTYKSKWINTVYVANKVQHNNVFYLFYHDNKNKPIYKEWNDNLFDWCTYIKLEEREIDLSKQNDK